MLYDIMFQAWLHQSTINYFKLTFFSIIVGKTCDQSIIIGHGCYGCGVAG